MLIANASASTVLCPFSLLQSLRPAVSTSEGINILRSTPSILSTLQENVRASDMHPARPRPGAHDLLANLLVDHPHPLTFCDALRIRVREAAAVVAAIVTVAVVVVIAAISGQQVHSGLAAESDESTGKDFYYAGLIHMPFVVVYLVLHTRKRGSNLVQIYYGHVYILQRTPILPVWDDLALG